MSQILGDGYTITPCEKDAPGSDIIMHIKPNADEENYDQYLETYKLQELIKKYSDYIRYPIVMEVEDYRQKPKPDQSGDFSDSASIGSGTYRMNVTLKVTANGYTETINREYEKIGRAHV